MHSSEEIHVGLSRLPQFLFSSIIVSYFELSDIARWDIAVANKNLRKHFRKIFSDLNANVESNFKPMRLFECIYGANLSHQRDDIVQWAIGRSFRFSSIDVRNSWSEISCQKIICAMSGTSLESISISLPSYRLNPSLSAVIAVHRPDLVNLTIYCNCDPICNDSLIRVLTNCTYLVSLRFLGLIGGTSLKYFNFANIQGHGLQSLDLSRYRHLENSTCAALVKSFPLLTSLNISDSILHDSVSHLAGFCHLKQLNVESTLMRDDDMLHILRGKSGASLELLQLFYTELTDVTLCAVAQCCPRLRCITCSGKETAVGLAALSQGCPLLSSLTMCMDLFPVDTDLIAGLSAPLRFSLPNLRQLHWNSINLCGKGDLSEILPSTDYGLTHLVIQLSDGITDGAMKVIGRHCPLLCHLNIRYSCCVSDEGVKYVFHNDNCLQHFDAKEATLITNKGVCLMVRHSRALESVCLNGCSISQEGFLNLLNCRRLRSVAVENCPRQQHLANRFKIERPYVKFCCYK